MSSYDTNLDKNKANHIPLTPLTFLERAKDVYPNYEAIVYEDRKYTWTEVYKRAVKFASALSKIGISKGDTVSFLAFNTPEIFEAHYSVPMTGGVLNTINVRLDANTIAYILEHSEAKVLVVDRQLHVEVKKALNMLNKKITIIDINDKHADQSKLEKIGDLEYENFLSTGDENYDWKMPDDEWQAISLSYTSGTTGNPKGVVYHHRGAYLMSTGSSVAWNMPNRLNFLTIVPMFHCNGWCYPWTIPMLNGRTVCLRNIDVKKIFELIEKYNVTHFGGAPIILNMITGAPEADRKKLKNKVYVLTAGAPPPSIIFKKMKDLGFEVMHVYGLTETYGHVTQCAWNDEWNSFDEDRQNEIKARQGVRYPNTEGVTVMDPETMKEVPHDGKTVVYHHRGAYLMSTGSSVAWNMPNRLNFLTIVPMFHCNGWCYPWTIPMLNGRTVCLRNIDVKKIFELIEKYNVTHFGGAPIILNMITGAPEADRKKLKNKVYVLTAGAPPPSIIFKKMKDLGFEVMHVYGLTETYGHVTQCAWNDEWNSFDEDRQNEIKARQGVRYPNTEGVTVMDPETMKEVPHDGKTIGEIMIRGNVVMKGYFKDKDATDKAMSGGWFHTGDLAVMHPDGYVKIQDRSKDIIISGGENISSIEIENTLAKHPSVSIAAVVAKPDDKWGEVPCAFIEMVQDKPVTEKELIDFCKETLAGFKVPKKVVFCELPKTSTGKIQKFELRKQF